MRAASKIDMLKIVGGFIAGRIAQALATRDKRIDELEKQLAELQKYLAENPMPDDKEGWRPDQEYFKNNFVSFQGSAWICKVASSIGVRPGTDKSWRLVVRHGRDSRDKNKVAA